RVGGWVLVGLGWGLGVILHRVWLAGVLLPIHKRAGRGDIDDQLLVNRLVRLLHMNIAENAGIQVANIHHDQLLLRRGLRRNADAFEYLGRGVAVSLGERGKFIGSVGLGDKRGGFI